MARWLLHALAVRVLPQAVPPICCHRADRPFVLSLPDIVVAADPQVVSWGGTSPDGRAVTGSLPTMKRLFNPNNTDED